MDAYWTQYGWGSRNLGIFIYLHSLLGLPDVSIFLHVIFTEHGIITFLLYLKKSFSNGCRIFFSFFFSLALAVFEPAGNGGLGD